MRNLLAILALTGTACAGDAAPDARLLTRLVHQDCGSCHGMTLKGGLGPDIRADKISHYTPERLKAVILDGMPGTPMPPWRPLLTDAEADWIVRYLLEGGES
ncbi:MAG: cytochrome c [Rhodobacter sp.]|jgi:cytochrome c55X|nr:cytochrome c [Rhodobacter sp.]